MIDRSPVGRTAQAATEPTPAGGFAGAFTTLRSAISMLTRIPVAVEADGGTGARAYGVVGALVGLMGAVPLLALGDAVPTVASILSIAAMAALSGAVHLDGLADTADAIAALGPDGAERARRDPAIGVAGAATLFLVLALEIAPLASLLSGHGPAVAAIACIVAATVARTVPVVVVRLARSSAIGQGLGAWFAAGVTRLDVAFALVSATAIALGAALAIGRPEVLLAGVAGGLFAIGLSFGLLRVRRQLDGDLLGAGVELAAAGTLAAAAVLAGWPVS
ncbi:MAG TPA: adenosylcobinamide-GDP ribazoletransferase [Candidatus Limnocylindrales bacterium]|nr:adenosylcobinamide-GDP ribazoletransferase [Candidatus Limnocylindrales bacterium]